MDDLTALIEACRSGELEAFRSTMLAVLLTFQP